MNTSVVGRLAQRQGRGSLFNYACRAPRGTPSPPRQFGIAEQRLPRRRETAIRMEEQAADTTEMRDDGDERVEEFDLDRIGNEVLHYWRSSRQS
ncbi:hypothetical protein J6590_050266 [Homalodisca vitripennis]|nr:hypothetical protein J6590_050266 [Homalodisca vitripennis]